LVWPGAVNDGLSLGPFFGSAFELGGVDELELAGDVDDELADTELLDDELGGTELLDDDEELDGTLELEDEELDGTLELEDEELDGTLEVEDDELDDVVGGGAQPDTQKTLCFTSAPLEPSALMVSLTCQPWMGCGSMPERSSV
jgi:hypothetical protein